MDEIDEHHEAKPGGMNGRGPSITTKKSDVLLADLFHIDGVGFDVMMTEISVSWKSLSDRGGRRGDPKCVYISDMLGASVIHQRRVGRPKTEGPCIGIAIHAYEKIDAVHYVERVTEFANPSADICTKWCSRIRQVLAKQYPCRPLAVKIFIHPLAGKKEGLDIFSRCVQPLFAAAGIKHDLTDLSDNTKNIEDECRNLDFTMHNSIVCIGGDGTVGRVVSGLLNCIQKHQKNSAEDNFSPMPLHTPIGIIPVGSLNQIAFSVLGTDDVMTATIQIMLGCRRPVDICSVWQNHSLLQWSFGGHFGYFASILSKMKKLQLLGEKKIEASVMYTMRKQQYSGAFDCKVEYAPYEQKLETTCREECAACKRAASSQRASQEQSSRTNGMSVDHGQSFDNDAVDVSDTSSASSESVDETCGIDDARAFQSVEGNFVSVSILPIAGLCSLAPLGMSKNTHLSDGCIDLVLVENVPRKDFVRYLKRFGNAKDQLQLPFVRHFHCKEVLFHLRSCQSWIDESTPSGDGEMTSSRVSGEDADEKLKKEPPVVHDVQENDTESDNSGDGESTSEAQAQAGDNIKQHRRSLTQRLHVDRLLARVRRTSRKSTGQTKAAKSCWNINNEICNATDLRFVVHSGLVTLHGQGIPWDYHPADVKMPCLAIFQRGR